VSRYFTRTGVFPLQHSFSYFSAHYIILQSHFCSSLIFPTLCRQPPGHSGKTARKTRHHHHKKYLRRTRPLQYPSIHNSTLAAAVHRHAGIVQPQYFCHNGFIHKVPSHQKGHRYIHIHCCSQQSGPDIGQPALKQLRTDKGIVDARPVQPEHIRKFIIFMTPSLSLILSDRKYRPVE